MSAPMASRSPVSEPQNWTGQEAVYPFWLVPEIERRVEIFSTGEAGILLSRRKIGLETQAWKAIEQRPLLLMRRSMIAMS